MYDLNISNLMFKVNTDHSLVGPRKSMCKFTHTFIFTNLSFIKVRARETVQCVGNLYFNN